MKHKLTRFRIENLYGHRTVDLTIEDNKLVLVGENGTGKSTVANLIYYFLTCQWPRTLEYQFEQIVATIDGEEVRFRQESNITKVDERLWSQLRNRLVHGMDIPIREADFIANAIRTYGTEEVLQNPELFVSQIGSNIPASLIASLAIEFGRNRTVHKGRKEIEELNKKIKDKFRVLYLPTYRRIEQDLQSILGVKGNSSIDQREYRRFRERVLNRERQNSYLELVEFGMTDVEHTIAREMTRLKDNVRNGLNELTGTYLKDVVGGKYSRIRIEQIASATDEELLSIFDRIGEDILTKNDKDRLKRKISEIKEHQKIKASDKVIAHFLFRLLELHKKQQDEEKDVREFVAVCNKYLVGKMVEYDHKSYSIYIRNKYKSNLNNSERIEMSKLSSGEKQIVSLMSNIYLSHVPDFFVIIDEPELSLSVPWQENLLPDIMNSGRCNGIIAVTHSPFIYNNDEFRDSVRSLEEFVEVGNELPG